ncbi:MAG: type I-C CRISPR-associated protein Cas7/Csd2, partial [Nitrospiraceae bacterium]|nr:type I-C CRISPR-associated protein Cas7/Csd2 [Nitrospiraceae bacterium]
RSIDPILPLDISITRMAVTNERDLEKERTMGRKSIVPYGLYRAEGYISAHLAKKTGFSDEDLKFLWEALINMFDHDHSAARGKITARKLIVFKHDTKLGNAPAHELFDLVRVTKKNDGPPRAYFDYDVTVSKDNVPEQVKLQEKL